MDSIVKRLHEKRRIETAKSILESNGYHISESGVYSPYDQSDRDNSDYHKDQKNEEQSHPYVGKKVRWSENGRTYTITGAYEDSRGVIVRCGDITMKPDEYKLVESEDIDEASESLYHQLSKIYPNKREFKDKSKESGNLRDLIDDLENKGIEYEIYNDKTDNGCTVFYDKVEDLAEAGETKRSDYEYEFAIKYRLAVQSDVDEYYQYPPNMDYMEELQDAATTDWNNSDMHQYAPESLEMLSTTMSFDGIDCIITVITGHALSSYEISRLEDWITGQMSDGWGEGFEQREIATGRDTTEEWVEPEDEDEEGYYDSYDVRVDYYGQFWWSDKDPNHMWAIERIS